MLTHDEKAEALKLRSLIVLITEFPNMAGPQKIAELDDIRKRVAQLQELCDKTGHSWGVGVEPDCCGDCLKKKT